MATNATLRQTSLKDKPATNSFVITPHASNDVGDVVPRGIYSGGGGTLAMRLEGDTADVPWIGVTAGDTLDVSPSHIRVTGTTCTGIIGLY